MAAIAASRATSSQLVVIAVSRTSAATPGSSPGAAAQAQLHLALVVAVARRKHRPQALEEGLDRADDNENKRQPIDRIDGDVGRENQPLSHRVVLITRAG
jgi:hypothetical protein